MLSTYSAIGIEDQFGSTEINDKLKSVLESYSYGDYVEEIDVLNSLIENAAAIDKIDYRGKYFIHYACQYGHVESVELILRKFGASIISMPTKNKSTPLHLAAENGQTVIVELLLKWGVEADALDGNNCTPLHLAAKNGHSLIVEQLLTKPQKYLDTKDSNDYSPLMYGVYDQYEKIVETLLKHGANPNVLYGTQALISYSIDHGYVPIVRLLLKHHACLEPELISTTLYDNNVEDSIKELIKSRQNLEEEFFHAVKGNTLNQVQVLYEKGIYVECLDAEKRTALSYTLELKYWELSAWLISKGADLTYFCANTYAKKLTTLEWEYLFKAIYNISQSHIEAPIYTFYAKTRFFSEVTSADFDIYLMYKELFGCNTNSDHNALLIKYTRPILEVLADYGEFNIIYDAQATDVYRMNSAAGKGTVGYYSHSDRTLYIAGKREYEEVIGTLIHELCHLVCDLIWRNRRNPYFQESEQEKIFIEISQKVKEAHNNKIKIDPIISSVFDYDEERHARELIVRVPQLIAGKGHLRIEALNLFPELLSYYEEYFLTTCQNYLDPTFRLKLHYLHHVNIPFLFDENRFFHVNDFPVMLDEFVEDINQNIPGLTKESSTQREPISSSIHLIKHFKLNDKILISGAAGMGKSILCQNLLFQWASNQSETFDWVFKIPLRHLNKYNYPDNSYEYNEMDILCKECLPHDNLLRKVLNNRIHTDNVLWILDGYDELSNPIPKQLKKVLKDLLKKPSIIITSRPNYKFDDVNLLQRRLNITGFSNPTIRKYIEDFFNEKPNDIKELKIFIDENSIESAYIPINLELICNLWENKGFTLSKDLSLNRTQLYLHIVLWLLRRFLIKDNYDKSKLNDDRRVFRRLSEEIQILEKIAFYLMLKQANVSADERLNKIIYELQQDKSLFEDIDKIGFLTRVGSSVEHSNFEFIHQSFQEFFCACHLKRCLLEKANLLYANQEKNGNFSVEQFIADNKYNPQFEMVWWFVAGLLKEYPQELVWFFDKLEAQPRDIFNDSHIALIIRCLDESQVVTSIADKSVESKLTAQFDKMFNEIVQHITQTRSNYSAWLRHTERFRDALALSPSIVFAKGKEEFFLAHMDEYQLEQLTNARPKQAIEWWSRVLNKYGFVQKATELGLVESYTNLQLFNMALENLKQTKVLSSQYKIIRCIYEVVSREHQLQENCLDPVLEMLKQEKERDIQRALTQLIAELALVIKPKTALNALDNLLSIFGKIEAKEWNTKLDIARAIANLVPVTEPHMAFQHFKPLLEVLRQTHDDSARDELAEAIANVILVVEPQSFLRYFEFLLSIIKRTEVRYDQCSIAQLIAQIVATTPEPQLTLHALDDLLKEVLEQTQDKLSQQGLIQTLAAVVIVMPEWTFSRFDSLIEVLKKTENEYTLYDLAQAIAKVLPAPKQAFSQITFHVQTFNDLLKIFEQMRGKIAQGDIARVIAKCVAFRPQLAIKAFDTLLAALCQTDDWIVQRSLLKAIIRIVSIEPQLASKASIALIDALLVLVNISNPAKSELMNIRFTDSMQSELVKAIAKLMSVEPEFVSIQTLEMLLDELKKTENEFVQSGLAKVISEIISLWPKGKMQSIELAQKLLKFFDEEKIVNDQLKEQIWCQFNFAFYSTAFVSVVSSIKDISLKSSINLLQSTQLQNLLEGYKAIETTLEEKKAFLTMLFVKCYSEAIAITLNENILSIYFIENKYTSILSSELNLHVELLIKKYIDNRIAYDYRNLHSIVTNTLVNSGELINEQLTKDDKQELIKSRDMVSTKALLKLKESKLNCNKLTDIDSQLQDLKEKINKLFGDIQGLIKQYLNAEESNIEFIELVITPAVAPIEHIDNVNELDKLNDYFECLVACKDILRSHVKYFPPRVSI